MPYKSEKIKLGEKLDRRIKLSSAQKIEIKRLYDLGYGSLMTLAKKYNVSKKTILLIVNKESKEKADAYIKNNWKHYQQSKEDRAKAKRDTRRYKQQLYLKGVLQD